MKKKIIVIFFGMLLVITALFFTGGFKKRTDVVLRDYSVTEDGKIMTLNIDIASSVGYARDLKVKQGGDNKYITFYATFGFLNSKLGAKSEYQIELDPLCKEIYFYKGDGGYNLVLKKDEVTNEWKMYNTNVIEDSNKDNRYNTAVTMNIKNDTLTSKGATFILKNNTDKEYSYEPAYYLEKKENGNWEKIKLDEPLSWNTVIYNLKPREEIEINIDWSMTGYGVLKNGEYRFVKTNLREKNSPDSRTFSSYVEFEIK